MLQVFTTIFNTIIVLIFLALLKHLFHYFYSHEYIRFKGKTISKHIFYENLKKSTVIFISIYNFSFKL